jgi:hypothetical protein
MPGRTAGNVKQKSVPIKPRPSKQMNITLQQSSAPYFPANNIANFANMEKT